MTHGRAVFSFLNPGVFVVIAKLQKAEIRLRPFPEPPNSGGALAPPAPPLNTALGIADRLRKLKSGVSYDKI